SRPEKLWLAFSPRGGEISDQYLHLHQSARFIPMVSVFKKIQCI
ncbi:MAG: hypothetical protein ACI9HA_002249, partial [Dinoroseobacter sp.]